MILPCAHCGRQYDVGAVPPGGAVACECGDLLSVPSPEDLENETVVRQFVERWAQACNTTAEALTANGGWEFIAGSAEVRIEHDAAEATLTIRAVLLAVPEEPPRRLALFDKLLHLNYHDTGEARFAVLGGDVVVTFTRPTLGLDYHEFQQAIEQVARTADDYDDELRREFADDEAIDLSEDEV